MEPFHHRVDDRLTTPLELDGEHLTIQDVIDVARHRRRVTLSARASRRIRVCRAMVDVLLERGEKVYGLTTGFGKLRDVVIPADKVSALQINLIRSHAAGVGRPLDEDVVRAATLLRANTLCRGNSGIRLDTVRQLVQMLNDDVYPYVPAQGSVGASGDLSPLSHLALVLIGDPGGRYYPREGRATPEAVVREAPPEAFLALPERADFDALARREGWRFAPVDLAAKEGLALNNGTQIMTAVASLAVYDAWFVLSFSELSAAMSLEAQRGVLGAYDPRIHAVRPQRHQDRAAAKVSGYLEGSEILAVHLNTAHLERARRFLDEARTHLDQLVMALHQEGKVRPAVVIQTERDIATLERHLAQALPTDEGGHLRGDALARWRELPQREQLVVFDRQLMPLRAHARAILGTLQLPTFPEGEASSRIESALVGALDQIKRAVPDSPIVQDDYSFRCFPQVLGTAYRAFEHVAQVVEVELNSATDNPLLFPPEHPEGNDAVTPEEYEAWLLRSPEVRARCADSVLGGGNFHGEPIAVAMDYLAIAVAEVGNITERRIAHLVDDNHSRGLPPFLIRSSGLNSGFMIPQYTAAALVSENKTRCHPASVDSIPTCANTEDHVSMGTIAARKAAEVIRDTGVVVSIELLTAFQGLQFRAPLRPGLPIRRALEAFEAAGITPFEDDGVMYHAMERTRALMDGDALRDCLL